MTPPKPRYRVFLAILIALIAAGATVCGFLVGRSTAHDSYVQKVSALVTTENSMTWLYPAIGAQIDDPVTAEALAKLYGVRLGDRDALVRRLSEVAWVPAYGPAPFVGNGARPMLGDDPHINILGFRDERQSYVTKADRTVRVFMTGGSTAWGSGASSQKNTISYILERILNQRMSPVTGFRYEVINTAFPAWSTTQEKLLIQQRLLDLHPDVILMFSGNNDVHWSRDGRDVRWFYAPMDDNHVALLNELYRSSGHPEWVSPMLSSGRPIECTDVAPITARNVEEAAIAASGVKARLMFALQPNVATTAKRLTKREQQLPEMQNKPYWESCYRALRDRLRHVRARNYRLIDLSRIFGEVDGETELFVDSYHFADAGNRLVAQALADQIDWRSIVPSAAVRPDPAKALKIISASPADASGTVRIVPNRVDKRLLVIFDTSVLPTDVSSDAITATIPAGLRTATGKHRISIVDGLTGETSPPVAFQIR